MRASLTLLLLLHAPGLALAAPRAEAALDGDDPRAVVTLLADREAVAPGERVRVGVRFELDPGWHVYWRNPGQAAFATSVIFEGDLAVGPLRWPAPHRFEAPGPIVTYGYGEQVLLFAEAEVPAEAAGTLRIAADADFLVCEVDCIPGRALLELALPVGEGAPSLEARAFDAAAAHVPREAAAAGVSAELVLAAAPLRPGDETRAALALVPAPGTAPLAGTGLGTFIPERHESLEVAVGAPAPHPRSPEGLIVPLTLTHGPDAPGEGGGRFGGVLTLHRNGETLHLRVDTALARGAADAARTPVASALFAAADVAEDSLGAATEESPGLALMLLFAFLGGLLLNLMPCVLPVLALKVVGLVELGGAADRQARAAAFGYVTGVVGSLLALGVLVAALAAAGRAVGWGFQLQEPVAVTLLMSALVVFALHLFGVWRVGTPNATGLGAAVDARRGFVRSAGEGVLAVVLATPCSAPFLGTAVGFALGAGPATILLVFAVLGLGLALPFGLAALVPGLRRRLPRPGPWMTTLEHVLGFALLGTAIWLAWVLVALAGADGVARGLAFALASGAVAFVAGHSRSRRPALVAGLLLLLAAPLALRFTPPPTRAEPAGWEPWSPAAVDAARDAGRTVFVDFTADWCITCKANERLVLADPEVEAALARGARLLADWTRRDDVIRAELRAHGKGGVPLYLVYRPGEAVEVLPELLTKERVLAALAPR